MKKAKTPKERWQARYKKSKPGNFLGNQKKESRNFVLRTPKATDSICSDADDPRLGRMPLSIQDSQRVLNRMG